MRSSCRRTLAACSGLAALVLAVAGCSNGDSGHPAATASRSPLAIQSSQAAPPSISPASPDTQAASSAPKTSTPSDICASIEQVDATQFLGDGPFKRRICAANAMTGTIGAAVWIRSTDSHRVSVAVVSNKQAGGGYATFAALYSSTPAAHRCTIIVAGGSRRCIDERAAQGSMVVDMGETYYMVWAGVEGGEANLPLSGGTAARMKVFTRNVGDTIYG